MSEIDITVKKLGKQYRIGGARRGYRTIRETLTGIALAPYRRIRRFGSRASANGDTHFWALKDINFEVKRGEILGIIGRNGAGKSTLLKILSRITDPTEGRVEINGRVGSLLEVGTGFHPELTGRENIYLNGAILGMKRGEIQRKFDEIVNFSEIEKFLDTPVKYYSSGMYMRLAFAVAAHLEPEILVVDEVLAVGDAEFQKKCLGKMKEVGEAGRTVLFISHNMNAIEQLCTRAILLESGRIKDASNDLRHVIKGYLFGTEGGLKATTWENTEKKLDNPWFRPTRFFLTDAQGRPLGPQQANNADVWINLEADIQTLDQALTVGYAIYNEDGYVLFWSYQTDTSEDQWPKLKRGRNLLRSQFPKRLLNEGTYRIEMLSSLSHRQWLSEPGVSAPFIFLTIQGGLSDSPLWMERRPGMLAPVLPWELAPAQPG
ncbi:MAG: ABC transporter ATP-binding protein [Tepidisphaeraceae bacterium]